MYQKQPRMKNSYLQPSYGSNILNTGIRIFTYSHHQDLIFSTQVSQYLSITVACSTLKQAVCVATLPQYTQNFIFLSDSFVKSSTYCNVFTSMSPHLIFVNAEFSKNYYHQVILSNVI